VVGRAAAVAALLATLSWPSVATAGHLHPFQTPAERLLEQAREARMAGRVDEAEALLDHAEARLGGVNGPLLLERGLLAKERGLPEVAVSLLERAADLDPSSVARLERARILVGLGRWPEAVVTLRKAFDERGSALEVEDVVGDVAFGPLGEFEPYRELIDDMREEQAGIVGKLKMRLEKIEQAAAELQRTMERITAAADAILALLTARWFAVAVLMMMTFVVAAGLGQMRILRPPWTVVGGWLASAGLWHAATRVVTGGDQTGFDIIGWSAVALGVPVSLGIAVRAVLRLRARRAAARREQPPTRDETPPPRMKVVR